MLTSLIAATLVTAIAGTTAAQPGIAGTEQDEQPSDLSEINGHPIPVGNHNQYYYTFKRRNISANPLGWIVGIFGVSGSYALNDNFVLKGDLTVYDLVDSDTSGFEASLGLPIYLRRAYSGAFLEPGLMLRTMRRGCEYCDYDDDRTDTTFGPQVLFGWHWTWDSGFNLAVASGVGRNLATSGDDKGDYHDDEPLFFNGYFRVGYQF